MVRCERCNSRFHSARALAIENCPRCLLRDDVTAPLVVEVAARESVDAEELPLASDAAAAPLDPEPA